MNIRHSKWLMALVLIGIGLPATVFSQVSERTNHGGAASTTHSSAHAAIAEALDACADKQGVCCQGLSAPSDKQHLRDILVAAVQCKNSDEFNLCERLKREEYTRYLSAWIEKLKLYFRITDIDPLDKLEIQKEIHSIEGRKTISANIREKDCLKASCRDCEDAKCRKICSDNRKKMINWRSLYKNTMKGNQYLKCENCLQALETYYQEQKKLYLDNRLNAERMYTKKHIEIMWGLLFCLAQSPDDICMDGRTCLDKAQDILPHALLPFVLPPAELIKLLGEIFQREGGITQAEIEMILNREQQSIYLIKVLVALLNETGRVPDIPPADLSSILLNLIKHHSEALTRLAIEDRLVLFGETMSALSETDIKAYQNESIQNKKAFAGFFVKAIRNADKDTLEMLDSVGFTDEYLTNLIVTLYTDSKKKNIAFIDKL
ncbi:MAG: hypothetical protein PVJ19_23300, partial [Desulfobacteraceae bacterium]